jgi:hypothetical protein
LYAISGYSFQQAGNKFLANPFKSSPAFPIQVP